MVEGIALPADKTAHFRCFSVFWLNRGESFVWAAHLDHHVLFLRGTVCRKSVSGRQTFRVLRSTCSYSSANQANKAFHLFGVDK